MNKAGRNSSYIKATNTKKVSTALESTKALTYRNEKSLEAVHCQLEHYSPIEHPYFGYYTVNIFDCPNFTMFTNNDCPRAMDILFRRSFEPMSMRLWCKLVKHAGIAIDIGAHVGVYSLAAAALRSDLPVLAIEPNPDVFARLKVHCELNKFKNIDPIRLGIADRTTSTNLKWRKKPGGFLSSGSSFVVDVPNSKYIEETKVAVTSLDEITKNIQMKQPVIIKIDVEGAEVLVIKSMTRLLASRPDIIIETFFDDKTNQISDILSKYNYSSFLIDEVNMKICKQKKLQALDPKGNSFNQLMTTQPKRILGLFPEYNQD